MADENIDDWFQNSDKDFPKAVAPPESVYKETCPKDDVTAANPLSISRDNHSKDAPSSNAVIIGGGGIVIGGGGVITENVSPQNVPLGGKISKPISSAQIKHAKKAVELTPKEKIAMKLEAKRKEEEAQVFCNQLKTVLKFT